MGSSRPALAFAGRVAPFGLGIAAVLCARHGWPACVCVLALAALWAGAGARSDRPSPLPSGSDSAELDALQAERRMLASLLDQTPAPLLTLQADGGVRASNRAARRLFRTEMTVRPSAALREALETPAGKSRASVVLEGEGGPRTYAMSIADLQGPLGAVRVAALLDIQPELHAAEAGALREMMQVLSHEIMNALTPVASLAASALGLLEDGAPDSVAEARDGLGAVVRRAEGLSRFVDAYRTLARLPPPCLAPMEVAALLEEAARLFRSRWTARGVALEVRPPAPDISIQADEELMLHALGNLLSNGAQAALAGPGDRPWVRLAADSRVGGVRLRVEDSGAGVSDDLRPRVFQPFFTTKPDGAGVGLSFARQVALSHGGDLVLAPSGSAGAVFHLDI